MKKILLVEDDKFLIDIYKNKLQKSGFEVLVAENGPLALKKSQETPPDLVVLDVVLPEMEGWEILKRMRQNPALKDIKAIFLSNLGQRDEVDKGLKLGALKYLIKSQYTPSEVVAEIKKII